MLKYCIKRVALMLLTFFIIVTLCFMLIRLLPRVMPSGSTLAEQQQIEDRWNALGYNKPLLVQYFLYLKGIFTSWDFGTSWYIAKMQPAIDVLAKRLLPTVLVNVYALIFSIPIGLGLGILSALKKNKWQDHLISAVVMLFVSIPSFVYAFLVQYVLYFKLGWFPVTVSSLADAGGTYFSWVMFHSMVPPIIALSFGEIARLTRFTRAELCETLTSEYVLFARAKGLTNYQATLRHALKNALVPILPVIISSFVGILAGSLIIERIFAIPGVGQLYVQSITLLDYDVFMVDSIFYTLIGLFAGIIVDISYGLIDPRIRIGER